jgi:C-terminal processing protease CtpA/Prc
VLVSVIMPVGDGFSLQYPLSDYITIQGVRLEGNGVKPDVIVEDAPARLPGQPDLTLLKAVELTKTG